MARLWKNYHLYIDDLETLFVCGLCGWMSSVVVCRMIVQGIMHHFAVCISSAVMHRHLFGIAAESAQELRPFHSHGDMLHSRDQQSRAKPYILTCRVCR